MNIINRFIVIIGIVSFSLLTSSHAGAAQKQKTLQSSPGKTLFVKEEKDKKQGTNQPDQKVEKFINVIQNASSMEEIAKAFKKQKFSKKELEKIEKAVKTSNLSHRLDGLAKNAVHSFKEPGQPAAALKRENIKLQNAHKQMVRATNQRVKTLMAQKKRMVPKSTVIHLQPVPALSVQGPSGTLDLSSYPHITRVEPETGRVNANLTFLGENFGSIRGTVSILTGSSSITCSISQWTDTWIMIRVPSSLQDVVRDAAQPLYFYIKNHEDKGCTTRVSIEADLSLLHPAISVMSPTEITPGQQILIGGTNFLSQKGQIRFIFNNGTTSSGIIEPDDWTDTHVLVKLEERLMGLFRHDCRIELINSRGLSTQGDITFLPVEEVCSIQENESLSAAFIFGKKRTHSYFRCPLPDGWRITNSNLYSRGSGIGFGAVWKTRPQRNSDNPYCKIEYWVEAFSSVMVTTDVYMQGPLGTLEPDPCIGGITYHNWFLHQND